MELKEFVQNVLVEINEAVDEARQGTSRDIYFDESKSSRTVEFDIAVTASDKIDGKGKAGIKVLTFAQAGGEIAQQTTNSTVSRVQFGLHISSDTKEERQESMNSYVSRSDNY